MAEPGEPPTSTQTAPDSPAAPLLDSTVPERIPLPPPPVAPPEAPPRRRPAVLDYVLAVVAVGFAFLVASAPARNSDLWLHLATGRALVGGQYHFGVDPFAQGTEGVYWVNTNWLYDLLTYAVFQSAGGLDGLGGMALVLLKALLVTGLAAVLVRLGWCGRGLWAPAVGAAWAVLVLSPWLMLHPMIVSYLFLALTLYFLERPHWPGRADGENGANEAKPVSFMAYWPLLPLFVLWVNLDGWFLLGPLTVALYLIGQVLQSKVGPGRDASAVRKGEAPALALVLAAGLAACLINPHHVYALLTPPAQLGLSPATHALHQDPTFQNLLISPFQAAYLRPDIGWNAAGMAYYALALLGGLSFLSFTLNPTGWRWRRGLVWLAMFLLSAFQVRAVPFFAIAAGPMLALNVQEFLAHRHADWARGGEAARWAVAGRVTSLLAGLLLLAAAWPGWLHAAPYEPPRWDVDADPSLRRTATEIARWRKDRLLGPDDLGFNLSTDAANYFAWFCPEEKSVLDARHPLFPAGVAADFVAARRQLSALPEGPASVEEQWEEWLAPEDGADPAHFGGVPMADLRDILRRRGVNHLILYESDRDMALGWVVRLQHYPQEWPLLHLDGRTAVFGWRDPEAPAARDAFAGLSLDLNRLAFQPSDDQKAPPAWPGREPQPPDWSDGFLKPRTPRSARTEEAALFLGRFDLGSQQYQFRTEFAWREAVFAGAVGTAACANGSVVAPYEMTMRLNVLTAHPSKPVEKFEDLLPVEQLAAHLDKDYRAQQDDGPPALLYLALRAARRAVHDNPDDPHAYLVLGKVYKHFLNNTREQAWNPPQRVWEQHPPTFPLLYRVRTAEAVAAYKHALALNPDLEQAHMDLIDLYQDMNYKDLVLEEIKEVLRASRAAGRRPGEDAKHFSDRILDQQDLVEKMSKDVADLMDKFEVKAAGLPAYPKAEMAWQEFGLGGKALSLLLDSDVSVFGDKGMAMELEMLLHTGRVEEVRKWPDPDKARDLLGAGRYLQLQVELAAASGDYQRADDFLEELTEEFHSFEAPDGGKAPIRAAEGLAIGQSVLQALPQDPFLFRSLLVYPGTLLRTEQITHNIVQEADFLTLRGLLAVESGEVGPAKKYLRAALSVWGSEDEARLGAGLDFPSRVVAQYYLDLLTRSDAGH